MNDPNYLNNSSPETPNLQSKAAQKMAQIIKPPAEPRVYSKQERVLLALALVTGVFQQLIVYESMSWSREPWILGIFYLPFFAVFTWMNWERLKADRFLLLFTASTFAVSLTPLVYPGSNFALLQLPVMWLLVTGLVCYTQGGFRPKEVLELFLSWFIGIFISRLSALGHLVGSAASIGKGDKKQWRNIAIGVGAALVLLCVLIPLMMQADMAFEHYLNSFIRRLNLEELMYRGILTLVFTGFTWSLLWNSRYGNWQRLITKKIAFSINGTVAAIALVAVLASYALFCGVQFTFLFAKMGLPANLTYSQYAVSGFWQLVQIAFINFALFGLYVEFAPRTKLFDGLLLGLLAATGVILASAILRLSMYIGHHGMLTWLRLISMWFLIYVAAVLIICILRLFLPKLPAVGVALLLLVLWFAVLGFVGPDRFIAWFNSVNWIYR